MVEIVEQQPPGAGAREIERGGATEPAEPDDEGRAGAIRAWPAVPIAGSATWRGWYAELAWPGGSAHDGEHPSVTRGTPGEIRAWWRRRPNRAGEQSAHRRCLARAVLEQQPPVRPEVIRRAGDDGADGIETVGARGERAARLEGELAPARGHSSSAR